MSSNTWQTYSTAIGKFNQFRYLYGLPLDGLPPVDQVVQFIAYMSACNCAPSTIRTYISGLSFWYKVQGCEDVTKAFIVTKLLEGAKRGGGTLDNRVPITLNILTKLVQALDKICVSSYEISLFRAAFCLAFFGFLRVGEFTSKSLTSCDSRPLQFNDVDIIGVDGCRQVKMTIRQSKTDQLGKSVTLLLSETASPVCPLNALSNFLRVRNPNTPQDSQLLIYFNGNPLTRYQFSAILTKCFRFSNVLNGRFRSHSFRIGAATEAAMRGSLMT